MQKMKAIRIAEPGKIELIQKDIPEPKDGEALLKIEYCGICGSDMATYNGTQPFSSYPRIPGHEFSARIADIRGGDGRFKKGMLVTAVPYFSCGGCYPCSNGKTNCCEKIRVMGVHVDGAFTEFVTVPVESLIDGKNLSPKVLAAVEPFCIGRHAVKRCPIKAGENVLVIGAGPIGIMAMINAKLMGARVHIADMLDRRLELAKELGADTVIRSGREDLSQRVRELTGGRGMDTCIEAVGQPATFLSCIDEACYGGKIILIGNGKKETTFVHSSLLKKELSLYASRNSRREDFLEAVDLFDRKEADLEKLITTMYDFDHAVDAFHALLHNDGSMAKVMIRF